MLIPKSTGGNFTPIPAGTCIGVCYRLIDLGTQTGKYGEQRKVCLSFEAPAHLNEEGKPLVIDAVYTFSGAPQANLTKMLTLWLGPNFTQANEAGQFDLRSCVGMSGQMTIVQTPKHDNPNEYWTNLASIVPLMQGVNVPQYAGNDRQILTLDEHFDINVFNQLGEYRQKQIMNSPEYKTLVGQSPINPPVQVMSGQQFNNSMPPQVQPSQPQPQQQQQSQPQPIPNDNIPF